ncbi:TPA: hypothetical protein NJ252_004483 [Vibrio parahaemolyticus]|nr:hypothetical protein [Vibrio parahaemolyticus]
MEKLAIAIVSCLIGVLIGHRFQLGRDKRKEYNDAVLPLKQRIQDHSDELSETSFIFSPLKKEEIKKVRFFLKSSKYQELVGSHAKYNQKLSVLGKLTQISERNKRYYSQTERDELISALHKMDELLPLK